MGKCKSVEDEIALQSKVNTYLYNSFTNVAFGGNIREAFKTPATISLRVKHVLLLNLELTVFGYL